MKKVIAAFAIFFSIGYAVAQGNLCDIITVIKDGKVTNCVICGAVVSCS